MFQPKFGHIEALEIEKRKKHTAEDSTKIYD